MVRAFLERGIQIEFEWPLHGETKDDDLIRRHCNQAQLYRRRQRNEHLSQERNEADAARRREFRNLLDEQLSQQRHETAAGRDRERNIRGCGSKG